MKRVHIHLRVDELGRSIGFYSKLFAAEPVRVEADYAKWLLDDPALNFAISTRGESRGIDHLGIQADSADELAQLRARGDAADLALLDQGETACCYARSEKHWITDPQGIAWEHFHTLAQIPLFGDAGKRPAPDASAAEGRDSACCAPAAKPAPAPAGAACCAPTRGKPAGIAGRAAGGGC